MALMVPEEQRLAHAAVPVAILIKVPWQIDRTAKPSSSSIVLTLDQLPYANEV